MLLLNTNQNLLLKAAILALCIVSFVHVFLFPLYDFHENLLGNGRTLRTFYDLEQTLCIGSVPKNYGPGRKRLSVSQCPRYGIVTVSPGGRLGNQMWEYASVWATARRTGLEPYAPRCLRQKLEAVFIGLTVPSLDQIGHCTFNPSNTVHSLDSWTHTSQSIILPRFSIQSDLVLTWHEDIIKEFTFVPQLQEYSQRYLQNLTAMNAQCHPNCSFIGVHVRRTDYIAYLRKKFDIMPAGASFYHLAMDYFEEKYAPHKEQVVFVVVSDDMPWCVEHFGRRPGVHFAQQWNSPGQDLAILAACNHSIFDYGTFGAWGALLAAGETVFLNVTRHSSNRLGQLLANWHSI